jgi:hypothetical protein
MHAFLTELKRFQHRWQKWRLRSVWLALAGWSVLVLALLCWLDLIFSLAPVWRITLGVGCLAGLLFWLAIRIIAILSLTPTHSAIQADRRLKNRRRDILSALELSQRPTDHSPLADYLLKEILETARRQLRSLNHQPAGAPHVKVRRRLWACLAMALLPALFNPQAAVILVGRYLAPHADMPPYSRYVFDISPERAEVIYGQDQAITVAISGKPIDRPVQFITRQDGHVLSSTCFQSSGTDFVQRLEKVMQPMDYCFRVGKARSKWHHLRVLYQPQVLSARVTITPPAYTHRPERRFSLGARPLKGLERAGVALRVQSNRPLKSGHLEIIPVDDQRHRRTLEGRLSGPNEIRFQWEIDTSANLSVMLEDILGTPAREPLKITQERIADAVPRITINTPMAFSLATPTSKIPFYASIEEDIGLRRCDLFRALKGYQSRPTPIALPAAAGEVVIERTLDLADLGVIPGQVIELFLEAADTNPQLTGVGTSDIARILIISEDEYAQRLRATATLEAFEARFDVLSAQYRQLLQALEKTATALKTASPEAAERLRRTRLTIQQTVRALRGIADDFTAFDLEKRLARSAQQLADKLDYVSAYPGWQSSDVDKQLAAVSKSLQVMQAQSETVRALEADAAQVGAVGRVMELATQYHALVDRQKRLVARLTQYAAGERRISAPRVMADQQAGIERDFVAFTGELARAAGNLPERYADLRDATLTFAEALRALDIPTPMQACTRACRDEQPREAWSHGRRALEKMEQMLSGGRGNAFARICSGKMGFAVPDRLSRTMAEMLESLMLRYGMGPGQAGLGVGGGEHGRYLNGYSAFNLPLYGPGRTDLFSSAAHQGMGPGKGRGAVVADRAQYREVMPAAENERPGGDGFFMQAVPPRYRDAVKAFYGDGRP